MSAPLQVLLLSQEYDITDRVREFFIVREQRGFNQSRLFNVEYSINLENFDNFFSPEVSTSIFHGQSTLYLPVKVKDRDGNIIWDGLIKDIERDHREKTVQLKTVSALHKFQNVNISYTSSDWETAAAAAKNIMDNAGFTDYDGGTITKSDSDLTSNNCFVKVDIGTDDNGNLMNVLAKLAEMSASNIYTFENKVYFQHWQSFTGNPTLTIEEKDMLAKPIVNLKQDIMVNAFSIFYSGDQGVAQTDTNNIGLASINTYGTRNLPQMRGDDKAQIQLKDSTTATYIGEQQIKRTHKDYNKGSVSPLYLARIDVSLDFKENLNLNSILAMNFDDESWVNTPYEITSISYDYNRNTMSLEILELA
jgi:hypothetical protein